MRACRVELDLGSEKRGLVSLSKEREEREQRGRAKKSERFFAVRSLSLVFFVPSRESPRERERERKAFVNASSPERENAGQLARSPSLAACSALSRELEQEGLLAKSQRRGRERISAARRRFRPAIRKRKVFSFSLFSSSNPLAAATKCSPKTTSRSRRPMRRMSRSARYVGRRRRERTLMHQSFFDGSLLSSLCRGPPLRIRLCCLVPLPWLRVP